MFNLYSKGLKIEYNSSVLEHFNTVLVHNLIIESERYYNITITYVKYYNLNLYGSLKNVNNGLKY